MPGATLRVAAVQAEAVPGDVAANLRATVRWLERAAEQRAALVVFPEAFTTGYDEGVFAGPLPDADLAWCAPVQAAIDRTGVVVVLSSPLDAAGRRTLSSVVLRPGEEPVVAYDKIHLDGPERELFVAGESHAVIGVDGVAVGLSICADSGFASHAIDTAAAGAEFYVNSGAWFPGGEQRRDATHAARAAESGIPLVFAGLVTVSPAPAQSFIGGSAVFDAQGRVVAQAPAGVEGLAVADVPTARLVSPPWPAASSRRASRRCASGPGSTTW
jgi:predicted amidohydrolase